MAHRGISLLSILLIGVGPLAAGSIYVDPGGSGDAETIRDGLFMTSPGDTVLIACGTYLEQTLPVWEGRVILSETGDPECVTIDGEGLNRVFSIQSSADTTSRLEGLTIQNGSKTSGGGGAIRITRPIRIHNCVFKNNNSAQSGGALQIAEADPLISSCVFEDNSCGSSGGAIDMWQSSPVLTDCTFKRNEASFGGAVRAGDSSPTITFCRFSGDSSVSTGAGLLCESGASVSLTNCTFFEERPKSSDRAAIYFNGASTAVIENSIVASTMLGMAVRCGDVASTATLGCCDLFGNAGGDWVGCIADQAATPGNFSENPRFCGPTAEEFSVEAESPCLPGHHPTGYSCGSFVGAVGEGCLGGEATEPATWGAIKSIYR